MKRDKKKQLLHLFAGIIFILVAFYMFEHRDVLISIIAVGLGSAFLMVAGSHEWMVKSYKDASLYIVLLEALCMFVVAFHFFKSVTTLCYLFIVFGLLYLIAITYFLATRKKRYKRRRSSAT